MSGQLSMALEDLLHPYLGRYLDAPAWVKASAGRAYGWLPPRVRLGGAYERFRAEIASTGGADLAESLACRKLDATLRWALATVPAYRPFRALLGGHRDPREVLTRLPVTDKLDIKRHPDRYLSSGVPDSARLEMFTGGSTRTPMRFFLEKHVTRPKEFAFLQDFRDRAGAGRGELTLALRGRTVPSAALPGGKLWMIEPIRRQLIVSSRAMESWPLMRA